MCDPDLYRGGDLQPPLSFETLGVYLTSAISGALEPVLDTVPSAEREAYLAAHWQRELTRVTETAERQWQAESTDANNGRQIHLRGMLVAANVVEYTSGKSRVGHEMPVSPHNRTGKEVVRLVVGHLEEVVVDETCAHIGRLEMNSADVRLSTGMTRLGQLNGWGLVVLNGADGVTLHVAPHL